MHRCCHVRSAPQERLSATASPKALTAIHGELADSARRTEIAQASRSGTPRNWSLNPDTTKADLEPALLAIDLFPRATLLLLVFEGMQIADAATLLDTDPDLLKK